jgi:ribosome assembly protein 1
MIEKIKKARTLIETQSTLMSNHGNHQNSIFGRPEYTRLVTIAAHVDHGKTSLADNLILSNGIISERSAGTIRYLDSDPEEQRRGITMRASAIGLSHRYVSSSSSSHGSISGSTSASGLNKSVVDNSKNNKDVRKMIIHLIDSPGHTDFSREVSSSMLACDGAILVVDVVEGMGARTQQVIRETEIYQLVPILVLNKIDRLRTDLGLSSTEAYVRIRLLIETVNAAAASMINAAYLLRQQEQQHQGHDHKLTTEQWKEEQEKIWTFDPSCGNVIFASALFGWGFTVPSLSRSLFRSGTIPIKPIVLKTYLFGDYKLKDSNKIVKWKPNTGTNEHNEDTITPLFAKFALQPIWDIYDGIAIAAASIGLTTNSTTISKPTIDTKIRSDTVGMETVLAALQIGTTMNSQQEATFITNHEELQAILTQTGAGSSDDATCRAILRRYRPLADAVLDAVCDICPSPEIAAQHTRSQALALQSPMSESADFVRIRTAVRTCDDSMDAPTVAHVCKFVSTDQLHVRDIGLPVLPMHTGENTNLLLGVTRVLSGKLRTGCPYYVFGPKQDLNNENVSPASRTIRLYLLMGSSFVSVPEVPAGHLCAVYGLEDVQLKTATLSDNLQCQPLRGFAQAVRPLVKVSIEPELTSDAEYLERGLSKLSLADAAVEVTATDKGERLLACLGELHLEQSLLDLERVYCGREGIKIRVSDPIVDFAESTVWFDNERENFTTFFDDYSPILRQTTIPPYNEEEGIIYAKNGRMRSVLSGKGAAISLRVIPLSAVVYSCLLARKRINDDSERDNELHQLGRALNFKDVSAEAVLNELLESLYTLNSTGCGMISSHGVCHGHCVRGVIADEVYVPMTRALKDKNDHMNQDDVGADDTVEATGGIKEFELLLSAMKGINVDNASDADSAAFDVWIKSMKGSLQAGFEIALSAGPICEEPVRKFIRGGTYHVFHLI